MKTTSELWPCTKWEISSSIMKTQGQCVFVCAPKRLQPFACLYNKSGVVAGILGCFSVKLCLCLQGSTFVLD